MPNETNTDAVDQAVETTGEAVEKAGEPGESQDKSAGPAKKKGGRRKKQEDAEIVGPVRDQSGRRRSKYHGKGRLNDCTLLPQSMRSEAEHLLEGGATFEEATEWLNEHHKPEKPGDPEGVTLAAVTEYFRSNFDLQRRRVRCMQEKAQKLKRALTGDPHSAMGELADALFFTGVMGLTRGAAFSVKDAARFYLEREKLELRAKQVAKQLRSEVSGLERTLERQGGRLSAEVVRKIREIYGLIDQSVGGSGEGKETHA